MLNNPGMGNDEKETSAEPTNTTQNFDPANMPSTLEFDIPQKDFTYTLAGKTFSDPYQWLEDSTAPDTLQFDRVQSARTETVYHDTDYQKLVSELTLRNTPDDLQMPSFGRQHVIKFKAEPHSPRGKLLIAEKDDFLRDKDKTEYKVLIDFDKLCSEEGQNWFYAGVAHKPNIGNRMLVWLSHGGADASTVREFDIETGKFVSDGFNAQGLVRAGYHESSDSVVFAVPSCSFDTAAAGYPLHVKFWDRSTPIAESPVIFKADSDHLGVGVGQIKLSKDCYRTIIHHSIAFGRSQSFVISSDGRSLTKIPRPLKSELLYADDGVLLFTPKEEYLINGKDYNGGVIALELNKFLATGTQKFVPLFCPSSNQSLDGVAIHDGKVYVSYTEDVISKLAVSNFDTSAIFTDSAIIGYEQIQLPGLGTVLYVDSIEDTGVLLSYTDFKTPVSYYWIERDRRLTPFMSLPEKYNSAQVKVTQQWATSADGTKIPFFVLDARSDCSIPSPTIMTGYGGFQISITPRYDWELGTCWLEKGHVYVYANIRGGGEYGPTWHEAAKYSGRMRAYEDFKAVADRLVALGITEPKQLGITGGSNGGLLTGHMYAHWPELFGAVVSAVPLLDMLRFDRLSRGISWVEEYGSPQQEKDLGHLMQISPYHIVSADVNYPPLLLTTSNDDRVHPAHAQKMAAKLINFGHSNVFYHRRSEGGHNQSDFNSWIPMMALNYRFFEKWLRAEELD